MVRLRLVHFIWNLVPPAQSSLTAAIKHEQQRPSCKALLYQLDNQSCLQMWGLDVLQVGSEDIDSGEDSDGSDDEDSAGSAASEDAASQQDLVDRQAAGHSGSGDDGAAAGDDGAAAGDDDDEVGDLSWEAVMAAMQGGGSDAEAEEEQEQEQPDDNSPQPDDVKVSQQKLASNKPRVRSVRQKGKQNVQAKVSKRTSQLGKRPRQR